MSLIQSDVVRVFEKWALGIHHGPEGSVLVTGMNGEVVVLDAALREQRRWQAHEGAVNALRVVDGQVWTGGGDALVKVWDCPSLAIAAVYSGPKKPVTGLTFLADQLVAQSYDRAVFVWDRTAPDNPPHKVAKVASLVQTEQGWFGCPKTGSKAGDIGPLARFDLASGTFGKPIFDDGFGAWSLQKAEGEVLAFGLDLKACFIDLQTLARREVAWHSKSGAPSFLRLHDGSALLFGDGQIYHKEKAQPGPVKGLYCAIELPDHRIAMSGADGQVWVFEAG